MASTYEIPDFVWRNEELTIFDLENRDERFPPLRSEVSNYLLMKKKINQMKGELWHPLIAWEDSESEGAPLVLLWGDAIVRGLSMTEYKKKKVSVRVLSGNLTQALQVYWLSRTSGEEIDPMFAYGFLARLMKEGHKFGHLKSLLGETSQTISRLYQFQNNAIPSLQRYVTSGYFGWGLRFALADLTVKAQKSLMVKMSKYLKWDEEE